MTTLLVNVTPPTKIYFSLVDQARSDAYSKLAAALQSVTILVSMVSAEHTRQLKFGQKLQIGN